MIAAGSFAILEGLEKSPDLNGQRVLVGEFDQRRGRYKVTLDGRAKPFGVKAQNLKVEAPPPAVPSDDPPDSERPAKKMKTVMDENGSPVDVTAT